MDYKHIILVTLIFYLPLLTRDQSSTVKVSQGAELTLDNPVMDFGGTFEVDEISTLTGQEIDFVGGIFRDVDNQAEVTARVNPTTLFIDGSKIFKGDGHRMLKSMKISGTGNRVEGEVLPKDDINIIGSDSTALFALLRTLDQNLQLDGGTVALEEDLKFSDGKKINGSGTLLLNNRSLIFGAKTSKIDASLYFDQGNDIKLNANLHLSQTWTFSGPFNTLIGNGNTLFLEGYGNLVIEHGSSLLLSNIIIDGIAENNIRCLDNAGTITLQNVTWIQRDNFGLSKGGLHILTNVELTGDYIFAYQSEATSTIKKNSILYIDSGFTFSYDSLSRRDLICFEDQTSVLYLDGGTLYSTHTGMQLTKGTLVVDKDSTLKSDMRINPVGRNPIYGGIELGNHNEPNDMLCNILAGATLDVVAGDLVYNNVSDSAWSMVSVQSQLQMNAGTRLFLNETLNLGKGILRLNRFARIHKASGKELNGSVSVFG